MAYFSNGSDGDYYEAKYCDRCVHDVDTCAVAELHLDWNYEAMADLTKAKALNTLWPRDSDAIHNAACRMFLPKPGQTP